MDQAAQNAQTVKSLISLYFDLRRSYFLNLWKGLRAGWRTRLAGLPAAA
jgi:hypothetical protein